MMSNSRQQEKCRGCGKLLRCDGRNIAFDPETNEECKKNHYGGFVCSRRCDYNSSLELEQSMPGHSCSDTRLGCSSQQSFDNNRWED